MAVEKNMSEPIPVHQWTYYGNRVLMLRFVNLKHQSYNNFQWPKEIGAEIEAPDWNPKSVCGGGFHGWPWGIGIGSGKDPVFVDSIWQVVSADPQDIVWVDNEKAKCRKVKLEHFGSWWSCIAKIEAGRIAWIQQNARGSASSTGEAGSASSTGERGSASSTGENGSASSTGENGSASSTGWVGSASSTGWRGSASSTGERGSASSTGENGSASSTGERGSASSTGWRGSASSTGWVGSASSTGRRGSASSTGERGSASSTGEAGSASSTGERGIATSTGEESTLECGKDGICVSTADEVTWIARPGAVFVHRFERQVKVATFKGTRATDGERITFKLGKIVRRSKP